MDVSNNFDWWEREGKKGRRKKKALKKCWLSSDFRKIFDFSCGEGSGSVLGLGLGLARGSR